MVIVSKFESTCPNCSRRIDVGASVNWTKGSKATHVECPLPTVTERAETLAVKALADADIMANLLRLEAEALADDLSPTALVATALEIIADRLLDEYEATQRAAGRAVAQEMVAEGILTADIPKGIYRVSLTGAERRYGVDHVNVQVIPNSKYQNVKVGEWHGESIGTYSAARGFRYWPSVDSTGARTLAIRTAFDILAGSADPVQFAKAYAIEAQSCYRCGADLVDEKSRERLLGPECAKLV